MRKNWGKRPRLGFPEIKDDWRQLECCERYYINSQGLVLSKTTKSKFILLLPQYRKKMPFFYIIALDRRNKLKADIEYLFEEAFKKNKKFDDKWFVWARDMVKKYSYSSAPTKDTRYNRKCHDCGCPTNNYRCDACWAKIREKKREEEKELYGYEPDPDELYLSFI